MPEGPPDLDEILPGAGNPAWQVKTKSPGPAGRLPLTEQSSVKLSGDLFGWTRCRHGLRSSVVAQSPFSVPGDPTWMAHQWRWVITPDIGSGIARATTQPRVEARGYVPFEPAVIPRRQNLGDDGHLLIETMRR
jgi:hypothetical protein